MDSMKPVRVRFAPSPTGRMHLGSGRTALYNYLLAKRTGGKFVLRIEDTDTKRTIPGAEQELMDGIRWLGIPYDEGPDVGGPYGPYRQSERKEIYLKHAQMLVESGHAYPCFCTPERLQQMREQQQAAKQPPHYDGTCRGLSQPEAAARVAAGEKHVIRFKMNKEGSTTATDLLRGDITIENKNIDDYILVKSDGFALYHLAAMVDDHLMEITHVIRGSEWLGTFPLHVNILRAFGWEEPVFMHLSVFLKPSGKGKMSKREAADAIKDGHSIFVKELEGLGYIPEGVLNWMVLMGWGVAEDDVLTLQDMVERFDINHLNPSPAAINFAKLDHFAGTHIRLLSDDDLARRVRPFFEAAGYTVDDATLIKIAPIIKERMVTLDDAVELAGFFFKEEVSPAAEDLQAKGLTPEQSAEVAKQTLSVLKALPDMRLETAEPALREMVEASELSAGQVFGILRVAVTGQRISPPLFESMEIIGREKVLTRVEQAIKLLKSV